jgi:hypothetical protein
VCAIPSISGDGTRGVIQFLICINAYPFFIELSFAMKICVHIRVRPIWLLAARR